MKKVVAVVVILFMLTGCFGKEKSYEDMYNELVKMKETVNLSDEDARKIEEKLSDLKSKIDENVSKDEIEIDIDAITDIYDHYEDSIKNQIEDLKDKFGIE